MPGRPLIYGTTPEFLRCFCISSLDELPPVPQCENLVEMESESTEENDENVERGA